MKKALSLLLALVLTLSLCVTAFAGSTAGSTVLRLTGDAADQVVNLSDGQRISGSRSLTVRLNVLSDPGDAEYAVALNGKTVEADHSTSRYHFYYLPARSLTDETVTLSVSTQALENGTGTAADPYKIATAEDLKAFRNKVNGGSTTACAVLTADITLDKSETWTPIGTSSNKYAGTFDGDGHTISGINVNETGSNEAGLFGDTTFSNTSPVIKNVTIADSSIVTASGYAGGVAGYGGGVFENCHTEADVTVQGKKYAGGIIGSYKGTGITAELSMTQCSNRATVKEVGGFGGFAGGLIGQAEHPLNLKNSFNAGSVSSKPSGQTPVVGGLVGKLSYATTLENVYNVGDVSVSGGSTVAGLVGSAAQALTIANAYQHSTVTAGADKTGAAIVAVATSGATLKNVYKTGDLADYVTKGGTASVTGTATVKTEAELKELATLLGGEFVNDLAGDAAVNNGFPVLRWQNAAAAAADSLTVSVSSAKGMAVLDGEGSTDPANPTEKKIAFDPDSLSVYAADRIYLAPGAENNGTVELGLALSDSGELTQELVSQKGGYTADELYFYRTPAMVERTVYAVHTRDGTTRYYKLSIQRTAYSGTRYGAMSADWRDDNPVINTTYDAATGYLTATVNVHNAFARYTGGVMDDSSRAAGFLTYKPAFKYYASDALIRDNDANQVVRFARVGRFWMANESATDSRNDIPTAAWFGSKTVADQYIAAANALKTQDGYDKLPAELRTAFENAVKAVSDSWSDGTAAMPLYLDADGGYTTTVTALKARDAMGAPMTGEYKLEYQENLMLDYMDIIKAYLSDSTMGSLKYRALQNVLSGILTNKDKLKTVTAMAITDDTTKSTYDYYRQRIWRIVNASDMAEINSMLSELGLDKVALEVTSDKTQVIVGDKAYDLTLTGGSTEQYSRTEVTVTASRSTGMQRVFFTRTQNVTVVSTDWEAILNKGYTANTAYFYDTPTEQSLTIAVNVNEGGTTRYYNVKVVYPAQSGLALGPNTSIGASNYRENAPGGLSSYDSSTGYISGGVEFGSTMIYASMNLYTDGTADSAAITPVWPTASGSLYYKSSNQAYLGRPGYYWIPVSTTVDGKTVEGLLPMRASIPYNSVGACLTAAETARTNVTTLTDDAKELMASVYNKINGFKYYFSNALYLDSNGLAPEYGCTADKLTQATAIQARTYFGAPLYGDSLVEKELNALLDLTAIFTTWSTNADLAQKQFEAYQQLLNMDAVQTVMAIQSTADRDMYQKVRQAKWDLIHTTDEAGIQAVMARFEEAPQVTLGDINGDGVINLADAIKLVKHVNEIEELTTEAELAAADVNGDGVINLADAIMLVKYVNEIITEFTSSK